MIVSTFVLNLSGGRAIITTIQVGSQEGVAWTVTTEVRDSHGLPRVERGVIFWTGWFSLVWDALSLSITAADRHTLVPIVTTLWNRDPFSSAEAR
jgi:hypothetical protein